MDDYRWNYYHNQAGVPAFGSWDYGEELPYTQCFESARQQQAGLVRYGSYPHHYHHHHHHQSDGEERDLYVAGDLYQNDVVTPAVIVVPRRRRKTSTIPNVKEEKRQEKMEKQSEWGGYSYDIKEAPSPVVSPPMPKSKAIDEDLYKIPPEFLHVKPKRKRGLGLFSSCLLPACV